MLFNTNYFLFGQGPLINRRKIKGILHTTFISSQADLNKQLAANIQSGGLFSPTFDIWSANNGTSYLGIIIIFIDNNFRLNYKLIG
jgi:hypothetical protein